MIVPWSVKQKILLSHWLITFLTLTLAGTLAGLWFAQDQASRLDDFLVRESRTVQDLVETYLAVNAAGGPVAPGLLSHDFLAFLDSLFSERLNRPIPYKTTLGIFDAQGTLALATNTALNLSPNGPPGPRGPQLLTVPARSPYRLSVVPILHNGQVLGTIRMACLTVTLADVWNSFLFSLVTVLGLVFLAFGFLGTGLVHWALSPLRQLGASALGVSEARLDRRLAVPPGKDEVALMARTLNQLLQKLQRDLEFEEALVGQLSDELRAPLAALRGRNERALGRRPPPADQRTLEENLADIDRVETLLSSLLSLARADHNHRLDARPCDLARLLPDLIEELRPLWREKKLEFVVDAPEAARLPADPLLLHQGLLNILTNAVKFSPWGGRVVVTVESAGAAPTPLWRLVFTNEGPPIPEESLDLVFRRFYRAAAPTAQGFGLGLTISKTMIELHGGQIRAFNPPQGGAAFEVLLPRPEVGDPGRAPQLSFSE